MAVETVRGPEGSCRVRPGGNECRTGMILMLRCSPFLTAVAADVETERGRTLALAAPEELLREETPRWLEERKVLVDALCNEPKCIECC